MKRYQLVTGATGFVGRALVLELLARTEVDIVCLVRPGDTTAAERLHAALDHASTAYGMAPAGDRVRAVEADLEQDLTAVAAALTGQVDQIWHCAASLRYSERDREVLERTNIGGTGRLLKLAEAVGASAFHYVSTAYVVGDADGELPETLLASAESCNVYEETKLAAETLVLSQAPAGLRVTILRPGVVVGHSVTAAVSGSLTGMYGLGNQLARYLSAVGRTDDEVRIKLDPHSTVNLAPVDEVVREAVLCGLNGADRTVFNLTAHEPITTGDLVRSWCHSIGLPPPRFVTDDADLRKPEQRLNKLIGFYSNYMRGDKRFGRANTDAVVGTERPGGVRSALLVKLCDWYLAEHYGYTPEEPEGTKIVLVGGGYVSLLAYRALRRRRIDRKARITVVAPYGRHHFHGWTGEVMSGVLSVANSRTTFTDVWPDAEVVDGTATRIDPVARTVTVHTGSGVEVLRYDHLVLGTGSTDSTVIPGLADNALSPKDPAQLDEIIGRLRAMARDRSVEPIVVIGGGLAGVEMCAAVAESFARTKTPVPPIHLVHSGKELTPELRPRFTRLARYAHARLIDHGVQVRTGQRVEKVLSHAVELSDGTSIPAALVITTAGQRPVVVLGTEAFERIEDGRISTDRQLRVPGQEGVWAGGDVAAVPHQLGGLCPANALWAIKHGVRIGRNISHALRGRSPRTFRYLGLGRAGSLGVGKGVLHLYGVPFTGRFAWFMRLTLFLWFMPSRRRAVMTARTFLRG